MLVVRPQKLNLPTNILLYFVALRQVAAQGQSDKMVSNMEVYMKQRCRTEFLHAEKMAPTDIHWCLLNIYGDQTVDVCTVRFWVSCFSSGDSSNGSPPWCRFSWVWHTGFYSLLVKMHVYWWWLCFKTVLLSGEFALSNSVIVLFVSMVVPMEIVGIAFRET